MGRSASGQIVLYPVPPGTRVHGVCFFNGNQRQSMHHIPLKGSNFAPLPKFNFKL